MNMAINLLKVHVRLSSEKERERKKKPIKIPGKLIPNKETHRL